MTDHDLITNIPDKMKSMKHWVCWSLIERNGRHTKVPINANTGNGAQSNNPSTWSDFQTAVSGVNRFNLNGIGFMFGDGFVGVDIDHCHDENGGFSSEALDIINTLDSYTELSQSGKGVHIICTGRLPEGQRRKGNVEMYEEKRFFVMTGNTLDDAHMDVNERTAELRVIHDRYLKPKKPQQDNNQKQREVIPVNCSDDELIDRIMTSKQRDLFTKLMNGDPSDYTSTSEADLALCNILAFWTQKDEASIDRIYRRSGLYRAKWDRLNDGVLTYGQITIGKALSDCQAVYNPPAKKKKEKHQDPPQFERPPIEIYEQIIPEEVELGRGDDQESIADCINTYHENDSSKTGMLEKNIEKPEDVFDPDFIGALALAKNRDPLTYAKTKAKLKGIVNLNDVERAIKQVGKQRLKIANPQESIYIKGLFPDAPCCPDLRAPLGWDVNVNGVTKTVTTEFGAKKLIACAHPIFISKRVKNIETGLERMEITFFRDFKWTSVIVDRTSAFSRQSIITLADYGIQVSSETSKALVGYLDDFEAENAHTIPLEKSINRFGWLDTETFFPYCKDILHDSTGEIDKLIKAFREKGSLEIWKNEIELDRQRTSVFRFIVAASFASPLIYLLDQRVCIIHVWAGSQQGKTAAVKAGLSVWGNAEELITSFYTTTAGMERSAGTFHHLPLVIDERQVANSKKIDLTEFIYLLSLGKGKTRSSKSGKLQAYSTWQNIIMTTGEEPLTRENSQNGEITRVLELYAKPFRDVARASEMHSIIAQNYGHAGKIFIYNLVKELQIDRESAKKAFIYIRSRLIFGNNLRSHMDSISIVCTADYFSSMWIWNYTREDALKHALAMGEEIITKLETRIDTVTRAWDYVKAWLASNNNRFNADLFETWGTVDSEFLYVIPQYLNRALEDAGFAKEQCVREFGNRGYIVKSNNSDGYACIHSQRKINGRNIKVYKFSLKLLNDGDTGSQYQQTELHQVTSS